MDIPHHGGRSENKEKLEKAFLLVSIKRREYELIFLIKSYRSAKLIDDNTRINVYLACFSNETTHVYFCGEGSYEPD